MTDIIYILNSDLCEMIWSYLFGPTQIAESIKFQENIGLISKSRKEILRIQTIKKYLFHAYPIPFMIDYGIEILFASFHKNPCLTEKEWSLCYKIYNGELCWRDEPKSIILPSDGETIKKYVNACAKGYLGIVELTIMFIKKRFSKSLIDIWFVLKYGLAITKYSNIIKFIQKELLELTDIKKFDINEIHYIVFIDCARTHAVHIEPNNSEFDSLTHRLTSICFPIPYPVINKKNEKLFQILIHIMLEDFMPKFKTNDGSEHVVSLLKTFYLPNDDINSLELVIEYIKYGGFSDEVQIMLLGYITNICLAMQENNICYMAYREMNNIFNNNINIYKQPIRKFIDIVVAHQQIN